MKKSTSRLLLATALCAAVLSGCGGGDDNIAAAPISATSQAVTDLLDYMNRLIATGTNETDDPVEINSVTLAVDDTAEPVSF